MVYTSVSQLVGATPLMELCNLEKKLGLRARVLAKIEGVNPGGSVKDRVAAAMLDDAEARGLLTKDTVIIEPTSGNTGIGLCMVGASRGYRVVIVMPDSMSRERQLLMTAYGAELVLTPGAQGMRGAIAKAEELAREYPSSFIPGQFENEANALAHYRTTGPEIWEDTNGEVDWLVAGIGTGGTVTGTARYLKERKNIKAIGIEPASSAVLSGKQAGAHGLQGIGAGFIPKVLDASLLDEIVPVTEAEAYAAGRLLACEEGILAGISSGAALHAALTAAKRDDAAGKTIVVILPDTGDRYLSTELFAK